MTERAIDRRTTDITSPLWFAVSTAVFVVLGVFMKTRVLNWVYGPLFPVFFLYVIPTAARRFYMLARHGLTGHRQRS